MSPKDTDFELSFTAQLSGYTNGDSNSNLDGGHFFVDNSTSAKKGRIAYYQVVLVECWLEWTTVT